MLEEAPAMVGKTLEAPGGDQGEPRKDRIAVGLVINLKAWEQTRSEMEEVLRSLK